MTDGVDWRWIWAKSVHDERNVMTHWLPLQQHLDDTAAVAGRLVDRWVSRQVLARVAHDLPDGLEDVRVLSCWLAAVHDVAKASPAFAVQVPALADRMRNAGLVTRPELAVDPDRRRASHALVGHLVVREFLNEQFGVDRSVVATQLASIVGSHHGVPPEHTQLKEVGGHRELIGEGAWQTARTFFLQRASIGIDFARYRAARLGKPSQVLLTSIVILADWIASNAELFPLFEAHEPPADLDMAERLERGWLRLGLPGRWLAQPVVSDVNAAYRARFDPAGSARPVQDAAVQVARAQTTPSLIIIEAPMGAGKTEAALLAVEQLAAKSGADGCFVALPTQATTDAMFARVGRWMQKLPGRTGPVSLTLAHGRAALNDEFSGLVNNGRFASIGDEDEAGIVAHQWLRGRKKGVLAAFVVGTIDQVLFAGLKSRHLMLRHLALAGKVVVIDEVHAYDVYMSQYLHRVLHWLGAYGVPVVLLSATLPADRRAELLCAYTHETVDAWPDLGYPVIVGSGDVRPRSIALPATGTTVALDRLSDDLPTLVGHLRERLKEGGCAVVVRNTVARVQATAAELEAEFGAENVTINHSRFLACDRARIDRALLRRFGPDGDRPPLHIVVASQVVEQSLDVDFDLMATDLAPADLMLQRIGRLHRHSRTRPAPVAEARCAVVGVEDWSAEPVIAVAGSRRVYGDHLLFRSAALLVDRTSIELPGDIAPLVQRAYGAEELGPAAWQPAMDHAKHESVRASRQRAEAARTFLLGEIGANRDSMIGWVRAGVGDTDDDPAGAAQVRDGAESIEVLVIQRDASGGLLTPEWIERGGGEPIPQDFAVDFRQARVIAACALRLPVALSHAGVALDVISALEKNHFSSFHLTPMLRGQLVLVLDQDRCADIEHGRAHFLLTYDTRKGLIHERK